MKIYKLIPQNPWFVPLPVAQRQAVRQLRGWLPAASGVAITLFEETVFVDPGEDFRSISCPQCRQELSRRWWQGAMGTVQRVEPNGLMATVPCCSAVISLNDLRYETSAGFARFVLSATEPGRELIEQERVALEQLLACRLRSIWERH